MSQETNRRDIANDAGVKAPSAERTKTRRPVRASHDGAGPSRSKEKAIEEAKTDALVAIQRALVPLPLDAKRDVLSWFVRIYAVAAEEVRQTTPAVSQPRFEDLAAVFEAVHPETDVDRALAACYFHNEVQNESDVDTRTLANNLRQNGHNVHNISGALHSLNMRTPSFVMITTANKAHHKRYRITSAGTKYLVDVIRRRAGASAESSRTVTA